MPQDPPSGGTPSPSPNKVTYPGGLVRTQVYDLEGRITDRCYTQNSPNPQARCYRATYDAVGNPLTLVDPDGTDTVTYDSLDRLHTIDRNGATQTFDYNALGALHTNGSTVLDDQRNKIGTSVLAPSAPWTVIFETRPRTS